MVTVERRKVRCSRRVRSSSDRFADSARRIRAALAEAQQTCARVQARSKTVTP